jgi:hypothetical protein
VSASTNRSVQGEIFVVEAGVDTFSLAWRGGDRAALWEAFSRDARDSQTGRHARCGKDMNARIPTRVMNASFARSRFVLSLPPGALPVVFVETTLAVGADGLDSRGKLASAANAEAAEAVLRDLAERLGIPLGTAPATVRRFDLAVDCKFSVRSDAAAFIEALSRVELHRLHLCHRDGSLEWSNASGIQFRVYDKGAERQRRRESGASDYVGVVRLERQCRLPAKGQVTAGRFAALDLVEAFESPFRYLPIGQLVVAGLDSAYALIMERRTPEAIRAERLPNRRLATLQVIRSEGVPSLMTMRDGRDRIREIQRRLGVCIDVERTGAVHVGSVLSAAAGALAAVEPGDARTGIGRRVPSREIHAAVAPEVKSERGVVAIDSGRRTGTFDHLAATTRSLAPAASESARASAVAAVTHGEGFS